MSLFTLRYRSMKSKKRTDYISRDEYFMGIALLSAQRSKDPGTQVGACIVDANERIVGVGYNGFPAGCSDDEYPRDIGEEILEQKNTYVVHAEANAILNSHGTDVRGSTMYVGLFPCNECAKLIIQSGIKKIVYLSDKYKAVPAYQAAKRMFKDAGIKLQQLSMKKEEITISCVV
jgi:dCMP deaminase